MTAPALGVDLADVRRVGALVDRFDDVDLGLVFTPSEREAAGRSRNRHRHYAVCLAAKEAVGKALGAGLAGIEWPDVEAVVEGGALRLRLTGRAALLAGQQGRSCWTASFACWDELVMVQVQGW